MRKKELLVGMCISSVSATGWILFSFILASMALVSAGHAANPIGFHDGSTCAQTHGWACDADNYGMPLEIEFYKDAPFGSGGVLVGRTTADGARGPGVAQNCGGHSDRGYVYPTPLTLKDGQSHKIYAYARNIRSDGSPTGSLQILNTSPKTLQCDLKVPALSQGYTQPQNKQGVTDFCRDPAYTDARYSRYEEMKIGVKTYNTWWQRFEHWEVPSSYDPVTCPSGTKMVPANATEKANKGYHKYRCINLSEIEKYNNFFRHDAELGIQTIAVVDVSPPPYRYDGCTGFILNGKRIYGFCVPRDDAMDDFEDYVRFLADQYDGSGNGKITHFVIWNENASGAWFDYSPIVSTDGGYISPEEIELWIDKYADMMKRAHKALVETASHDVLMYASIDPLWEAHQDQSTTTHIGSKRLMDGLWERLGPGLAWSVDIHPFGHPEIANEGNYSFANLDLVSDYQRDKLASYGITNPDDYPQTRLLAGQQGWRGSNGQENRAKFVCIAHARAMEEDDLLGVAHLHFHNCNGEDPNTTLGLLPQSVNYDLSNMESDPVGLAYLATGLDQWGKRSDHYCCANHNLGCGGGDDTGQWPYGGSPQVIPGKIEAENFDLGGEGVAYHDASSGNSGGAYRTSEDVDIQASGDSGGGYNIGWIRNGEWLEYTVKVAQSGVYTLEARVASPKNGKSLRVEMDGSNVSGSIAVPNTGGWQNFQTVKKTGVSLNAGQHVMRVVMEAGGFNLNHLNFIAGSSSSSGDLIAGNSGKVVTDNWKTINWGTSISSPVVVAGVGSQYGGDTAGLRIKDVTGGGFTAFVEEETSANSEINHIPEEVHYLAMNSGAIREDGGSVIGEAGILAGNQANGNTWHTVNLTQTYSSPPVVLMSMVTFNGGQPAHIRLRNVTAGSFEYQIEEWDYLDQGHTTETMHYIALTPGTHTVDGKKVRAGTAGSVNQSWKTVNYGTTFSAAPAVISQAQTYNDAAAIVTRQKNAGSSRFEVRVQEEEGNNASHGSETVGFVAVDAAGGDGNGDPGQVPFGGSAHAIPGRIEAEDFDLGGEGVAYHDTESNNKGGDYRPQEGADIQNTGDSGGGYNVGWIRKGEWLEYTVNVAESRTYTLKARVATPYAGKTFRMEVDGQNVSGSISVPNTGGWQNFQTTSQGGISLGAGSHVIRLHFESGSMNLNFVELL